ncbi:sce7726 family protein [Lysinibacter sp. HNR]|uniref:sce7726 family protein n=1 Tax=Lysinibacter sp. HNR TaxID=3031408 RepID=UPI00243562DF|nr:sce7726 family protein [Lysinibacter sp. HNR]WGD37494.1 sce7726 family protein [Lysinibacter sp. HNR]
MSSTTQEIAALSRVFSPVILREIGKAGRSPLLARLLVEAKIPERLDHEATLADAFELAFSLLCKVGNRDDYVYRTAITQKIVLGRHNLRTATPLNEVRTGKSKADLVVLNGTATAYEIKSERDTTRRLANQLADYRSVFASVNVVTSPSQTDTVLRIAPEDVGVLALSARFRLQTVREPINLPERTSPLAIVNTLRFEEATTVLTKLGIAFPEVPNTQRWRLLREIFADLKPVDVHAKAIETLKTTRSYAHLESFVKRLPKPLSSAILSANLPPPAQQNLSAVTWQPLSSALAWS